MNYESVTVELCGEIFRASLVCDNSCLDSGRVFFWTDGFRNFFSGTSFSKALALVDASEKTIFMSRRTPDSRLMPHAGVTPQGILLAIRALRGEKAEKMFEAILNLISRGDSEISKDFGLRSLWGQQHGNAHTPREAGRTLLYRKQRRSIHLGTVAHAAHGSIRRWQPTCYARVAQP